MKLLIVSICKNEAATISELISRIPRHYPGITKTEICVIDDGSTDETAAIAHAQGADVISDGNSQGLAFRFRQVLDIALERDADVLVNIDGDLQFQPEDIPDFVKPIVAGTTDFVAADRFTDPASGAVHRPQNMPLGKYVGNQLGAYVVSRLAGRTFHDVTSGFRAYNRKAILALNLNSTHTYTQESFQIMAIKRLRIVSRPTHVIYFKERKSRVVTSLPAYILKSAVNIMRAYRDFAPLRFFFMLGGLPMVLGLGCVGFQTYHWLRTGLLSPYKFIGILGLYLISLGIFTWGLGIVADMFVRLQSTQERALELLKQRRK